MAEGRPGFRSVGVFGNDFYDKLLVLQAIRREFPTAIFFTTDLDARYLHPREFQWTRNLIVASSYGLELREELQAGVVPFRNNYETATFLATTVAVINAAPKDGKGISAETIRHWIRLDASRIYEVGRTELIDLTEWPRDRREGACRPLNDDCKNVHPVPTFVHRGRALGGWTVVALLGFVLAPLISSNVRRGGTAAARWCGDHLIVTFGIALAGAVAGVGVAMALAWEGNDSEPFRFFEGVSIWPSEIIRGLALAVAIIGIVMTDIRRRRTERTLGARYFGETPGRTVGPSVTELWDEAKRASGRLYAALAPSATPLPVPAVEEVSAWRRIFAGKPGRPYFLARSYIDVEEMWKEHCYQNASVARWTRVVVGTIIFFVFSATLILTVGAPNVPARGPVAPAVDTVVILVTVAALILLVFDIGDAIKLCDKFAYYLGSPIKNRWPSYTRREFGVQASDPGSALDTWIDVRFIAEWTGRIGGIIYYPFVVLLLMIVARSSIFDN